MIIVFKQSSMFLTHSQKWSKDGLQHLRSYVDPHYNGLTHKKISVGSMIPSEYPSESYKF